MLYREIGERLERRDHEELLVQLEVEVMLERVMLKDPKALLERLVKWDMLEAEVELEHMVKRVTRETLVVLANGVIWVHVCRVLKDCVELLASKVLLEHKDPLVLLVNRANMA